MCHRSDGVSLHTKDKACQELNPTECVGECAPNDDNTKCEISFEVFASIMFGNSNLPEAFNRSEQCGGDAGMCESPCMSWMAGCSEATPELEAFNANLTGSIMSKDTECRAQ